MEEHRSEDAYQLCLKLLKDCPDHDDAAELYKELDEHRDRAGELLSTVREGLGREGIDDLQNLLAKADETFPGHPERAATKAKLDALAEKYDLAIRCCINEMFHYRDHAAQFHLETARLLNPGCCEREKRARVMAEVLERARRELEDARRDWHNNDRFRASQTSDAFWAYWKEMLEVLSS